MIHSLSDDQTRRSMGYSYNCTSSTEVIGAYSPPAGYCVWSLRRAAATANFASHQFSLSSSCVAEAAEKPFYNLGSAAVNAEDWPEVTAAGHAARK